MTSHGGSRAAVVVENLTREFVLGSGRVFALRDVSLSIADTVGMVALMGPSGSGKSTLLNIIGALDRPSSGRVTVHRIDVATLGRAEQAEFRSRHVGFVFQNFNLIPVLTALENVMLPAQLARGMNFTQSEVQKRARDLLDRVGLASQRDQSTSRLSGGQMQRVAIARALMNRPRLILADEPTANLDHATAAPVLETLSEISTREGATVIIATHDAAVERCCRRVVRLRDGKVFDDQEV